MIGLLVDHNVEGHVARIFDVLFADDYIQLWNGLGLKIETCRSLGIPETTNDRTLWNLCQERGLSLVTANRNHDDENSLEAAIRDGNSSDLPVYTLGDADRVLNDSTYALAVGVSLLEYLLDFEREPESVLGTGRLFLPKYPV